jgi:hypothetical protein
MLEWECTVALLALGTLFAFAVRTPKAAAADVVRDATSRPRAREGARGAAATGSPHPYRDPPAALCKTGVAAGVGPRPTSMDRALTRLLLPVAALEPMLIPYLVKALRSSSEDVRAHIAEVLAEVSSSLPALLRLIGTGDILARLRGFQAMTRMGKDAVAPLVALLGHDDAAVRAAAADALGGIGEQGWDAIARLIATLSDRDADVRPGWPTALRRMWRSVSRGLRPFYGECERFATMFGAARPSRSNETGYHELVRDVADGVVPLAGPDRSDACVPRDETERARGGRGPPVRFSRRRRRHTRQQRGIPGISPARLGSRRTRPLRSRRNRVPSHRDLGWRASCSRGRRRRCNRSGLASSSWQRVKS